jgi:acetyl esterase/lipase
MLTGIMAALVPPASSGPVPVAEPGGETVDLWPRGTPGAARVTAREEIIDRLPEGPMRDRFAQHVTRPRLTLFAPQGTWNGITLLIVPGGGYVRVVIDKEGFESAEWFAARGFAAAVLRYRLPADGWEAGADAPVHDASRALRLLRHRSWPAGQAARRIGVIGFSAGGHLCGRLITEPSLRYPRHDAADARSGMPDFAALVYPVIATTGAAAHAGSVQQLQLAGVAPSALAGYSPHLNVRPSTPPTLLIHAADDSSVPLDNSLLMHRALLEHGVRSELHVFDRGGHGFGLRAVTGLNAAAWPTLVENWAHEDDQGR